MSNAKRWKQLLERFIDVILFLGERGLPLRGSSQLIGDVHNGNFLGILELVALYDPILQEHLSKIQESQKEGKRLQAHYLSWLSQNEFVEACGELVREKILDESQIAKYFSLMVGGTPDSAHTEQTTFILRYLLRDENHEYSIQERFLKYVDCNDKTGLLISEMILATLNDNNIPFSDCRGQGYDNARNMSGCLFSPCGCHSLNLCGVDSANACKEDVTFFLMVQKIYNLFSSSPKRWKIFTDHIGGSLHGLSETRWTARVASIRPFARNLPGIKAAVEELLSLNLTPQTSVGVRGAISYTSSFICILMSAIWVKLLIMIDHRNQIIQSRDATIDIEVDNLDNLITDITEFRGCWPLVWDETIHVATSMNISTSFPSTRSRKRKRFFDDSPEQGEEDHSEEK